MCRFDRPYLRSQPTYRWSLRAAAISGAWRPQLEVVSYQVPSVRFSADSGLSFARTATCTGLFLCGRWRSCLCCWRSSLLAVPTCAEKRSTSRTSLQVNGTPARADHPRTDGFHTCARDIRSQASNEIRHRYLSAAARSLLDWQPHFDLSGTTKNNRMVSGVFCP